MDDLGVPPILGNIMKYPIWLGVQQDRSEWFNPCHPGKWWFNKYCIATPQKIRMISHYFSGILWLYLFGGCHNLAYIYDIDKYRIHDLIMFDISSQRWYFTMASGHIYIIMTYDHMFDTILLQKHDIKHFPHFFPISRKDSPAWASPCHGSGSRKAWPGHRV